MTDAGSTHRHAYCESNPVPAPRRVALAVDERHRVGLVNVPDSMSYTRPGALGMARSTTIFVRARSSLQSKLFPGRQQRNRFANASLARLRPFGGVNPDHEIAPLGPRQFPKEFPRAGVRLQGLGNVGRQLRDRRPRRVGVGGRRRRPTSRREEALRLKLLPPCLLYTSDAADE